MHRHAIGFAFAKPGGVIAIAASWNALPRKPQVTDPTQKNLCGCGTRILRTKKIDQPKVKIDNIICVASGHFKKIVWKKRLGLVEYASGYGARADGYRLKREVTSQKQ